MWCKVLSLMEVVRVCVRCCCFCDCAVCVLLNVGWWSSVGGGVSKLLFLIELDVAC